MSKPLIKELENNDVFNKAVKIFKSCETSDQKVVAKNYAKLCINYLIKQWNLPHDDETKTQLTLAFVSLFARKTDEHLLTI